MWSILAAGQTIISCFDIESELSQFVRSGNCGISIEPDSAEKLSQAIMVLLKIEICVNNMQKMQEFLLSNMQKDKTQQNSS